MKGHVFKYRMFVQARFDLTPEEQRQYLASKTPNKIGPSAWPWRDTGEHVYARRRTNAKAFYIALRGIKPPVRVKAEYVSGRQTDQPNKDYYPDAAEMRAWREFGGIMGTINGAADEVRHFPEDEGQNGRTSCGIQFTEHWRSNGKPECPTCLEAAVSRHPTMKEYL